MQVIRGYRDASVDARGVRFHFLEWGAPAAPAMVLLHGLTGHAHTWDHVAGPLSRRYHIFAPDQRGHGDSTAAPTYSTQDFVEDVETLARLWQLERFVLIGLSMGAHNALAYAAAYPRRVSNLIAIDIPPKMDRTRAPNWDVISQLAERGHRRITSVDDAFREARTGNPTAPDENLRYRTELNLRLLDDGSMQWKYDPKAPARWEPEDLWPKLPSIAAPTLLVRGGKTQVLPRDVAEKMAVAIADAELVEIAESGHSVPTDCPRELTAAVSEWLDRRAER